MPTAFALSPSVATVFSLSYELPAGILLTTVLLGCYNQLLAAAHAHGDCRFWLLAMQQRNWHDDAFGQWFGEEFAPQAVALLGAPLFLACVVHPSQRSHVEASRTGQLLRRTTGRNLFPFYFENEANARAWLCDQHACGRPVAGARLGRKLAG